MNLVRLGASLLAGAVAGLAVLVGLTAALDPYVWPSALVAFPVALALGIATVVLTGAGLGYRAAGEADAATRRRARTRFLGALAGTAAFLVAGALAALLSGAVLAFPVLTAVLFVGFPVGLLAGLAAGLVTVSVRGRRDDGSRPAA